VLKQRVLTAVLLLPLAMIAIFALPLPWFFVLIAVLLLGGSVEYTRLAGLTGRNSRYLLIVLQLAIFALLSWFKDQWDDRIFLYLIVSCAAWALMFVRLPLYRPDTPLDRGYRVFSFITAVASITTGWFAICWIRGHAQGAWLILLLLLIVWAADTGAYFAGRLFGKKKLAPDISPGKTVAGFIGGLVTAPLVALLAMNWIPISGIQTTETIMLSLVTALVSVGGDLLISLHKRSSDCKDSGKLLPGHGGILDRLDSLLAAAPFFALSLLLTGL